MAYDLSRLIAAHAVDGTQQYLDVLVVGSYVFTACHNDGVRAYVYDGSHGLVLKDTEDAGTGYYSLYHDGTYLYVASIKTGVPDGRLEAFTFDGDSFTLVGTSTIYKNYYSVWGDGTYIYTSVSTAPGYYMRAFTFDGATFSTAGSAYTFASSTSCYDIRMMGSYIMVGADGCNSILAFTFDGSSWTLLRDSLSDDNLAGIDGRRFLYVSGSEIWPGKTGKVNVSDEHDWGSYSFDGSNFSITSENGKLDDGYSAAEKWGSYYVVGVDKNEPVGFDKANLNMYTRSGMDYTLYAQDTTTYADDTQIYRLKVDGNYLYVAGGPTGLVIYNLAGGVDESFKTVWIPSIV